MVREETVAFFKHREELWRRRDAVGLAAGHTESGVLESPMFGTVHGRGAIEKSYRDLFTAFADLDVIIDDLIVDSDNRLVGQVFRASATHVHDFYGLPGSGRRFELRGVFVAKMDGGRIEHERRFYDFTGLLVQVGVLKAKPGI
jgi:steroid delta-isomerase-like uncharacterized protein